MSSEILKKINTWYVETAKGARWMDLIGDYAGDELFVVDGESLLQLVLDDPLLNIGRGNGCSFQIIHAVYILESFLSQLLTRNANIEIVFFQPTLYATTRPGATFYTYSSRVLARQLLLKHLERLSVPVYHFNSLNDPAWIDHEAEYKPMFVLIADTVKSPLAADRFTDHYLGSHRGLVFDIISYGLPVALINGLEFRDSKVLTFVLERQSLPTSAWSIKPIIAKLSDLAVAMRAPSVLPVQHNLSSCTELLAAICRAFVQSQGGLSSIHRTLLYIFILHVFTLDTLSLKDRIQTPPHFSSIAQSTLRDEFCPTLFLLTADLVSKAASVALDMDMNIFCALLAYLRTGVAVEEAVSPSVLSKTSEIWASSGAGVVPSRKELFSALEIFKIGAGQPSEPGIDFVEDPNTTSLLPFSHPVFDDVLSSVDVATTTTDIDPSMPYLDFSHVFTDSQHWHNQNKLITLGETGSKKLSPWALRSNQRYMRSLHRQAETLTGALGQGLRQITIATVATRKDKGQKKKATLQQHANKKSKPKPLTKTERMKLEIAEAKANEQDNSSRLWFQKYLRDHKDDDIATKYASFDGLQRSPRFAEPWLSVEGRFYEMHLKICAWIDHPERDSASTRDDFTVSIMRIIGKIADSCPLSTERAAVVSDVLSALGFAAYVPQIVSVAKQTSPSPLAFKFVKVMKSTGPLYAWMRITEHPIRWQLRVFGPYMDRSMDGALDARVDFKPDGWQRRALDCIDDPKHSVLVVAPTSAGKTFVSFYAMEKVLRDSDDGIIVYIAPTKALVNQIVAEIYARFSKKLENGTLWAIHTRDYRVNDPQNCQIVVTVPEVLAIMLLSPPLASKWTPRMKRIILDEIHTIGQQDGGAVWEQILLLAPCPFIGLSATVGSPDRFNDWLASLAKAHGWNHSFIQHKHRYSHLRKFYYRLDDLKNGRAFRGLQSSQATDRLRFLHPISMLSFQVGRKTLPDDLALEPADTLSLFDVIAKQKMAAPDLIAHLDPTIFFGSVGCRLLRQSDILCYETELKQLLSMDTMNDATASLNVDEIVDNLTDSDLLHQADPESKDIEAGFLPLAVDLHKRQLLPAIFFNFDRSSCEAIAHNLLRRLVAAETAWKTESPAWSRKLSQWEAWKNSEKTRQREEDRATRARKKDPDDQPDDTSERHTWESTFDPDAPLPDFSFAGLYSSSELDEQIREELWKFDKNSWLIQALRRGIAVHHAGMNKRYRSLIESLFRRGIVRIMISTGTLALGINAPAKTSVFCGDSPFLTALMYRQCAGRAGRRGYDLLGNVIFYGLPIDRVQRLVLSKLPSLGGTFPLTATLTLRLLNLLHGSNNAPYAMNAIRNIMQLPQISFGSSMGRSQLQQHLRFNIEYLRRARLIDQSGAPINLSAICAHLYYTEPSNFALVTLLHRGILHRISEEGEPEREFICLMSHLFGRRYLPSALSGSEELVRLKQTYPSMIELPPLREDARSLLIAHDEEIRRIFRNYAMTYAVQYANELGSDDKLPLSGAQYPGSPADASSFVAALRKTAHRPLIRSHFVANSGHGDTFETIEELARAARSRIHLSEYAIPNMRPYTTQGEGEHTLNAYLLDFYIHGQGQTLAAANGIRKGDLWFLLQDFMLTLLTVKASLEQYLTRIALGSDVSEDVMAVGADLAEMDNDSEDGDGFSRPQAVSDEDWRVYVVVKNATAEFNEKYRKIWA